jgi:hypothetical protein
VRKSENEIILLSTRFKSDLSFQLRRQAAEG